VELDKALDKDYQEKSSSINSSIYPFSKKIMKEYFLDTYIAKIG